MKVFSILLFALNFEFSYADWLCTEAASQRHDNKIFACGIGKGGDENLARLNAFDNAKTEFSRLCDSSDDCGRREISVQPERTSCTKESASFKCYRLIVFTISDKIKSRTPSSNTSKASRSPVLEDMQDSFDSFSYEASKHYPKIGIGMLKKEVLKLFGAPESTSQGDYGQLHFHYKGKMCVYEICYVHFDTDGKVDVYKDFKPIYTEDLK